MNKSSKVKKGDVINVRFTKSEMENLRKKNIDIQKTYEEQARRIAETFKKSK